MKWPDAIFPSHWLTARDYVEALPRSYTRLGRTRCAINLLKEFGIIDWNIDPDTKLVAFDRKPSICQQLNITKMKGGKRTK